MKADTTVKPSPDPTENQSESRINVPVNRRSFIRNTAIFGAGAVGAGLLATSPEALAEEGHSHITRGDAAKIGRAHV